MVNKWQVVIACVAMTNGAACSAATQSGNGNANPLLSPLSAKEIEVGIEAGLGCDFSVGGKRFLIVTVGEAIVKTDDVVRHFRLDDDHALAIINFGGTFGDRSFRVLIDRDEIPIQSGAEGTVKAARLTVRDASAEQTLRGQWTCGA